MNRIPELAWLRFNRRVLDQTRRPDFPVLERLRFLGIWASNLDEFYAARIGRPFLEDRGAPAYLELLAEAHAQAEDASRIYGEFLFELARLGIRILSTAELTLEEKHYFGAYLAEEVAPRTDVLRADGVRGIRSGALYFASGAATLGTLIRMPDGLPRVLAVPGRDGAYVRLGELLRLRPDLFLTGRSTRLHELRVLRLAAGGEPLTDWSDLPEALRERLDGRVSHLEVERDFPAFWREPLRLALGLRAQEVQGLTPPLDLRFVSELVQAGPASARLAPLRPNRARRFELAPFKTIDRGDVLLFHPYQSYGAVEAFAAAAAADPEVKAVRATLYRVGEDNVLAASLMQAARAGKDVAVLLEGRARFDELTNMEWALRFRGAGVRVLKLPRKKVHAKLLWALRGGRAYLHVGTGNYHPTNGRLYTDFSLFTASPALTADAKAFFDALESGHAPALAALRTGRDIRDLLLDRIRAEGHPGGAILLKSNHLTDPEILEALDASARAGARVDLVIRTTLTRLTPVMRARSLVGRFLEHARAAAFRRDGAWEVWAGSYDLMPRNFDRRYEIMFPVEHPASKRAVLSQLRAQLRDDVNAYELCDDGSERARWGGAHDAQRVEAAAAPLVALHAAGLDAADERVPAPEERARADG